MLGSHTAHSLESLKEKMTEMKSDETLGKRLQANAASLWGLLTGERVSPWGNQIALCFFSQYSCNTLLTPGNVKIPETVLQPQMIYQIYGQHAEAPSVQITHCSTMCISWSQVTFHMSVAFHGSRCSWAYSARSMMLSPQLCNRVRVKTCS